jgi:LPS-assembly protein
MICSYSVCMFRLTLTLVACVSLDWLVATAPARAQSDVAGCKVSSVGTSTVVSNNQNNSSVFDGTPAMPVQIDCDEMQFFADHIEHFKTEGRIVAAGNVVFVSGRNRIAAERMVFHTKTKTGTFYVAAGTATLRDTPDPGLFGTQEPDLMFRGEEVHKLGDRKYRIVRGAFTTCVQPTPRWELVSGSITLTLDEYALLTNSLFKVKNVPLMYLPIFYYPIQEDNRATGFLIPIYGTGTYRGQSISVPFFWAIGRSHDATMSYDWFSKGGQQYGGEYRYILAPGSQGHSTLSLLNQTAILGPTGSEVLPARKSYEIVGSLTQRLPRHLYAQARANYTSSITTRQLYQQDVYQSTNRTRGFGGNLTGAWNAYTLSVTADRSDTFDGTDSFTTYGALPRVSFGRGERPIAGQLIYFGATSEFVTLLRSSTRNNVLGSDQGLSRMDVNSTVRIPFTRWPFLTANSAVSWRGTYWTESLDDTRVQIPDAIGRKFFDFQTRITGPVFNRIWITPGNNYAEKFKHVIEPSLTIQRVTAIDNLDRIVPLEGVDFLVGSVTSLRYGLVNRLYAKKETSREILSVSMTQSYHTDARAAQRDRDFQSTTYTADPTATKFTPLAFVFRGAPTPSLGVDFRTELHAKVHAFTTLAANGTFNGSWLQASGGWSRRRFIPELSGFSAALATHYLNGSTSVRRAGGRLGGTYSFNYDLRRDTFLQQRYIGFYNAQCCGIVLEYQTFNYQGSSFGSLVPQDRRFNLSFTLAGIGTFSNLLGAFGGGQGR